MSIPKAVYVQANSPLSYGDAIYRAICLASRTARGGVPPVERNAADPGHYQVDMKVTLLIREQG